MDAYPHAAETMGLNPEETRIVTDAPPSLIDQLLGMENRVRGQARVGRTWPAGVGVHL
ncbi:MAG: hypothetical protein VB036_17100 [Propionicimonas sp.]|nr:hypothetical protein [Propionicimonas sp.]